MLEANEIPPRVVDWWIDRTPSSPLRKLRDSGTYVHTRLEEELPRDLYPSQSWASVGMGTPWSEHGVFWYGDPKPDDHRFYWQRAAESGLSVGLVGVLHSSPVGQQCASPNFSFVIPDVFSDNAETIPAHLQPMQELNLRMTRKSARVASLGFTKDDLTAVASFARHGVRPATWAQLAQLAGQVATRRVNKERLRVGQALLMADVFSHLVKQNDPDLSVFFTNHVASAMHRYWAASFPEDWETHPYEADWIAANAEELPFAMRALDDVLGQLTKLCDETNRELIVLSSMGQRADLDVDPTQTTQAVVRNGEQLFTAMECPIEVVDYPSAMVPQVSATLRDRAAAEEFETWARNTFRDSVADSMINESIVTLTLHLSCDDARVCVNGRWFEPAQIGASIESISDHRSGRHDSVGLLMSSRSTDWPDEINALDTTRLLLSQLGVGLQLNKA